MIRVLTYSTRKDLLFHPSHVATYLRYSCPKEDVAKCEIGEMGKIGEIGEKLLKQIRFDNTWIQSVNSPSSKK